MCLLYMLGCVVLIYMVPHHKGNRSPLHVDAAMGVSRNYSIATQL